MSLDIELQQSSRETWSGPERRYKPERPHIKDSDTAPPFWNQGHLSTVADHEIPSMRSLESPNDFKTSADDATDPADIWNRKVVLSLDGGGVRGLSELYFLKYLMDKVAEVETKPPTGSATFKKPVKPVTSSIDSPLLRFHAERSDMYADGYRVRGMKGTFLPCHYFDYIGGTGVGGIIAVMLGRLRLSVDQAITHFERIWTYMAAGMSRTDRVLPLWKAKAANSESLGRALHEILADHRQKLNHFVQFQISDLHASAKHDAMSDKFALDSNLCRTSVLAMQVSPEGGLRRPYIFRSYSVQKEDNANSIMRNPGTDGEEVDIVDVCRATSAAVGFFKGVKIHDLKYRDGSIWNSNPAMEIYREIEEVHSDVRNPVQLMVSVGCGRRKSAWNKTRSDRDGDIVDQQLSKKLREKFCRFNGPSNLFDLEINEWRIDGPGEKTFSRIRKATTAFCEENAERIEWLARELVAIRRRRSKMLHWEKFALGMQYVCRVQPPCGNGDRPFEDRDEFVFHLLRDHDKAPPDNENWDRVQLLLTESQTTTVK